ncbi:MAG: GspH/FimT family pseudopilin [Xenococcaceae cyanobacterium MO_167.B27]|nr:GspH/FimT family pseudopilin [Xenococcaceae cyanobacterium MO_167.B27]
MWHWNVRKNQGFTLIEMLATAIIIGIVAAISAPNLLGLLNRNRVNQGLVQLEGAIKEAQRQAIRNGKTCKIKLTTTTDSDGNTRVLLTRVLASDPGETGSPDYSGCLLEDRILPRDVTTTTTITGTPTKITFSSKGNTDAASQGSIIISHSGTTEEKCLVITGTLGNILTGEYNGTNCITN